MIFPFLRIFCPAGFLGKVNCLSTFMVLLVWSNHVRIVGGQSSQSFGHCVELKMSVDVDGYSGYFIS